MAKWVVIDTHYSVIAGFIESNDEPQLPPQWRHDKERYIIHDWWDTPLWMFEKYRNSREKGIPAKFDPRVEGHAGDVEIPDAGVLDYDYELY